MKNIFDQFDKEDFYMIEFKMKEYGRSIGSFIILNTLWPWIQLLLNIFIVVVLSGVFTEGQPILYLAFLFVSFIYMVQGALLYFKKGNRTNVLKHAKYYFKSFVILGITFVIMGFSLLIHEQKEIIFRSYKISQLMSIVNILFSISIITVICSFIFMFLKLKFKLYRENDSKKNKIQLYNILSMGALPVVMFIVFIINLNSRYLDFANVFMQLFCILGGFILTSASADFYMVYYLRKRFPEDFYKEDQMEKE
ncbi:hypothetical protein ACFFIF_01315 [Vagococcus entomophilus]|uniref:Uncharacterized protein n=1 Tax=Vagococcus entomophilus TaxID=1160095 RepID=A0A430AKD0_9ENTE|nr:hypothetical protein [Vagococcus entomophilus]RSU08545.1 hypothetical protein CBF30_04740 [Vagococcus entomophilus]